MLWVNIHHKSALIKNTDTFHVKVSHIFCSAAVHALDIIILNTILPCKQINRGQNVESEQAGTAVEVVEI